jgi:hypothetical protein
MTANCGSGTSHRVSVWRYCTDMKTGSGTAPSRRMEHAWPLPPGTRRCGYGTRLRANALRYCADMEAELWDVPSRQVERAWPQPRLTARCDCGTQLRGRKLTVAGIFSAIDPGQRWTHVATGSSKSPAVHGAGSVGSHLTRPESWPPIRRRFSVTCRTANCNRAGSHPLEIGALRDGEAL